MPLSFLIALRSRQGYGAGNGPLRRADGGKSGRPHYITLAGAMATSSISLPLTAPRLEHLKGEEGSRGLFVLLCVYGWCFWLPDQGSEFFINFLDIALQVNDVAGTRSMLHRQGRNKRYGQDTSVGKSIT